MRFSLPPWLRSPTRQAIAAGVAAALLLVGLAFGLAFGLGSGGGSNEPSPTAAPETAAPTATPPPTPQATPTPTPPPTEPTLFDGGLVYPEDLAEIEARLPLAIMFDNIVVARPQVGLEDAELVFEAVAEGGITRFLAVFWRNSPGPVLPVRSARAYYLDWAAELDAVFVHWGAAKSSVPAADVATKISTLGIRDFDGFFSGRPLFERAPDRPGPHDGIANTDAIWEAAAANGWTGPPEVGSWTFKDDQPGRTQQEGALPAPSIDLGFGGPFFSDYAVNWEYDPQTNGYLRSQGGVAHLDGRSGDQIEARNVAVLVTSIGPAGDGTSHLLYATTGSGEAVVFQDGIAIPGSWSKAGPYDRTRFFDAEGNEIQFNRGQTWIEILSFGDPLLY